MDEILAATNDLLAPETAAPAGPAPGSITPARANGGLPPPTPTGPLAAVLGYDKATGTYEFHFERGGGGEIVRRRGIVGEAAEVAMDAGTPPRNALEALAGLLWMHGFVVSGSGTGTRDKGDLDAETRKRLALKLNYLLEELDVTERNLVEARAAERQWAEDRTQFENDLRVARSSRDAAIVAQQQAERERDEARNDVDDARRDHEGIVRVLQQVSTNFDDEPSRACHPDNIHSIGHRVFTRDGRNS